MLTFASTLNDIAAILHATPPAAGVEGPITGVSTDSRSIAPGDVFVALVGETADGHQYVAAALAAGAVGAVVSRIPEALEADRAALIVVPNTLVAYGQLGAAARQASSATIIGVTGSAGKTTAKNLIAAVLSAAAPTVATQGTQNNEIGVPLTLLGLRPEHRFCALELAMRGRGQIRYLAQIAKPHIGLITNVGESHIGLLGSREMIAQTKAELLAELPPDGTAILPRDDFFFGLLSQLAPCPVVSFGESPESDVWVRDIHLEGLEGTRFVLATETRQVDVMVAIPGRHIAVNAAAAAATCLAAGLGLDEVARNLNGYSATDMRMETALAAGGYTVINDAYNASPPSVIAALEVLGSVTGRRVFVFGDMLELGPATPEAHERVGRAAAEAGVAEMITVGEWGAAAGRMAARLGVAVRSCASTEEALQAARRVVQPGDVVLVKASRAIGLDAVARGLVDAG